MSPKKYMKELRWDSPITKKLVKEAEAVNLTLLSLGSKYLSNGNHDMHYRRYRFNKCGHIGELRLDKVRWNIFKCKTCMIERHKKEAEAVKLELIEYLKKNGYAKYKCKICAHIQDFQQTHVRNNKVACEMCHEEKLKKDAQVKDLEIINRKEGASSIYRFIKCGHEREITHSHVRGNNEVTCLICFEEKLNKEANKAGLKIIGKANSGRGVRRYRFKECGHERDLSISNVRQACFDCKECGSGFRSKPSKIYILMLSFQNLEWLKLGYSKDIPKRIRGYQLHEEVSVSIIKTVDFEDGHKAYELESSLHSKNIKNKISVEVISMYMKSGVTECYPIEMKDKLLKELANLGNK
tara:strand:- start:22 stop:1080 length:1059 start_codon:yes stop_codon:yes gene_type:complete